jgi:hypothetical protein
MSICGLHSGLFVSIRGLFFLRCLRFFAACPGSLGEGGAIRVFVFPLRLCDFA